jgi:hypothetical protein
VVEESVVVEKALVAAVAAVVWKPGVQRGKSYESVAASEYLQVCRFGTEVGLACQDELQNSTLGCLA